MERKVNRSPFLAPETFNQFFVYTLPTISELRLPKPGIEDLVKYYVPSLGHRAQFIESFPPDLRTVIIQTLEDITRRHSPSADLKRSSEIISVVGVTAKQLRDELLDALPWIRIKFPTLHEDTVRHLLNAPHQGRLSKNSYRSLVPVKMALGRNNLREDNPLVRRLLVVAFVNGRHRRIPIMPIEKISRNWL
jgi:hypothetical protein